VSPAPAAKRLIMLGTAFETRGGISAVVNVYRAKGLFDRWPVEYVATHGDGSWLRKLWLAVRGLAKFLALLAHPGAALIHVHVASGASFWRKSVFMALGLLAGCSLVFHLHGGGFARFYEKGCGRPGRALARFFLKRSSVVIVLSQRWREWLEGIVDHPRIVCLANPLPEAPFTASSRRSAGNTVLFLGRLDRSKGIYDLLDVVSELRSPIPDIRLVCAGDGDLEAVREHATRLGIEDSLTLTGWIGPEEKAQWLKRADVFVLPSYAEGMPVSVMEAMAAGLPVLASAVGGIPDMLTDGVNGFLVAPNDKGTLARLLRRLLHDPSLRQRIGSAARETARLRFAADKVLGSLEMIYGQLGLTRSSEAGPAVAMRTYRRPV
jgi:glycosyltransferase involved in cell wall biosynthesis